MPPSIFEIAKLSRRRGASSADIEGTERVLGVRLPEDYRAFLRESNGAEGFAAPGAYVMLWSATDVVDLNAGYSVAEFAPGLVLIGTDGGDTGFGFVNDSTGIRYVSVPLVGMSMEATKSVGRTLADLVKRASLDA